MRVIATYTACIYTLTVYEWLINLKREWRCVSPCLETWKG